MKLRKREKLVEAFSLECAEMTREDMRAASLHDTDTCSCELCQRFEVYASARQVVEAWLRYQDDHRDQRVT